MKKHKVFDNPTGDDVYYEYGAPGAAYNAAGRVTKETVGTFIDQYRYGALGEVVKKTRTIDGKTYTVNWKWDNFGRLRSIVYSNNVVIYYAYDTGGQVKQVFGYYNGMRMDYVNNVYYDEFGSRTTIAYANGVTGQYSYDVLMHRLVQLKTFMGDSTYQNITYSYDKVGNIVTRSENGIVMSDNTVKNITHRYGYDSLYRLTQADGSIKENGNTVNSYTSTLQYSSIGTIVQKLQTVKIAGENDPSLTYSYNYSYAPTKPHAVAGINDNLTYRYDANGNMTAVYDTAKQFNRILFWDDDNRLTKTVDTTSGSSVTTQYNYDAKGMRIIKDGPYGKSIYIDTGYVESGASQTTAPIASNHIFMGNTRVASVVKHTEEKQPSTYFYASDHLGSSSVLTTNTGSYHERIEYLPYGETWVEDKAVSDGYTTPYKFTGKELDAETGLYYFGARYYDARMSRWISADPALADGKYFPKPNDYDTEHDFYWYLQQDGSKKLAGLGGVFNAVNMDVYHYAGDNPVKLVDPDGNDIILLHDAEGAIKRGHNAILIGDDKNGWDLFSKGGEKFIVSGKDSNQFLTFKTLEEFMDSEYSKRYEGKYRVRTSEKEDFEMQMAAIDEIGNEYSIFGRGEKTQDGKKEINCADFVYEVIEKGTKGRINIDRPEHRLGYTDPKEQFKNFKEKNKGIEIE